MTEQQMRTNVSGYRDLLIKNFLEAERCDKSLRKPSNWQCGRHALWMCEQIPQILVEGNLEKANRWLGFIQCAMWSMGIFSIEEMADHNR